MWNKALNDAIMELERAPGHRHAGPQLHHEQRPASSGSSSASRTTSSCPPTRARRPTASARSGPRSASSSCGRSPATRPARSPLRRRARRRWAPDDPRWPPIPTQDYSNLPRQQKGLHAGGFEYMRLSNQVEGMIANYQRLIDGYLAGLPYEQLVPAMQHVTGSSTPPSYDLGF